MKHEQAQIDSAMGYIKRRYGSADAWWKMGHWYDGVDNGTISRDGLAKLVSGLQFGEGTSRAYVDECIGPDGVAALVDVLWPLIRKS